MIASRTFLLPDEALDYILVNQHSFLGAYKASLTQAHPPLIYLLLYYWRFLGTSEFFLRLPFVLAGAAMPWVVFRWLQEIFGTATGFFGLLLLTFSPPLIATSAEIRPYAILLLFMAAALYFLETSIRENSPGQMLWFALSLYLAILTHYSAVWFTIAIGTYALLRVFSGALSTRVVLIWFGSQAGALALFAWLYLSHVSKIRGSEMEREAMWGGFHDSYFWPGRDHSVGFAFRRTVDVFEYVFNQNAVGFLMLLVFAIAVAWLVAKSRRADRAHRRWFELSVLLTLPFAVGCGGALLRLYPYGGTRHNLYLAPFAIAGIGYGLSQAASRMPWLGVAGVTALLVTCNWLGPPVEYISWKNQSKALMQQAVQHIRETIPAGESIVVDFESDVVLEYYLCPKQTFYHVDLSQARILDFDCGSYHFVSTGTYRWQFTAENFASTLHDVAEKYGWKPRKVIWIVHAGWNEYSRGKFVKLDSMLAAKYPEFDQLPHREFGENVAVFEIPIPSGQ